MSGFERHVFVCLNERPADDPRSCCSARGSEAVFKALKIATAKAGLRHVRVNRAGCMDHCPHGPAVVVYPEAAWYRLRTPADAERVVQQHLVGGAIVEELLMDAIATTEPGVTA